MNEKDLDQLVGAGKRAKAKPGELVTLERTSRLWTPDEPPAAPGNSETLQKLRAMRASSEQSRPPRRLRRAASRRR